MSGTVGTSWLVPVEAAPNVQDRHMYRPIPQKFIDTLQNPDGTNLSDADKKAWQNPGY